MIVLELSVVIMMGLQFRSPLLFIVLVLDSGLRLLLILLEFLVQLICVLLVFGYELVQRVNLLLQSGLVVQKALDLIILTLQKLNAQVLLLLEVLLHFLPPIDFSLVLSNLVIEVSLLLELDGVECLKLLHKNGVVALQEALKADAEFHPVTADDPYHVHEVRVECIHLRELRCVIFVFEEHLAMFGMDSALNRAQFGHILAHVLLLHEP